MNTVLKKYGAGIFGLLIIVLTTVAGIKTFDLVTVLQLLALIASTVVSVGLVGLLPGKWPGAVKTGVDLLGAAIALVLPYAIAHGITWNEIILVIIGIIKAAATEFGVQIRTDSLGIGDAVSVVDNAAVKVVADVASGPETPGTVTNSQ